MSLPESQATDDAALYRLAEALGSAMRHAGLRLAAAESCTGGWIAKVLTDVPGSSDWFDSSVVSYSNHAKTAVLGVSAATLAAHGAVSEAVVREMAAGARRLSGCPAAVAVSGIAGPGGATAGKPVGLVHFAWSLDSREWAEQARFGGDREAVRRQATALALVRLLEAVAAWPQGLR